MVNPSLPNLQNNLHLLEQYNFQAGINVLHVVVCVDDHAVKEVAIQISFK